MSERVWLPFSVSRPHPGPAVPAGRVQDYGAVVVGDGLRGAVGIGGVRPCTGTVQCSRCRLPGHTAWMASLPGVRSANCRWAGRLSSCCCWLVSACIDGLPGSIYAPARCGWPPPCRLFLLRLLHTVRHRCTCNITIPSISRQAASVLSRIGRLEEHHGPPRFTAGKGRTDLGVCAASRRPAGTGKRNVS